MDPYRLTVSLSNLFFIIPLVMLFRQPIRKVTPEIITLSLLTVVSTFYHLCDNGNPETAYCIVKWSHLYLADFVLSYQIVYLVFFYDLYIDPIFKYIGLFFSLSLNISFMFVPRKISFINYLNIFVIGSLTIYLRYKYDKLKNYNISMFLLALTYAFAGIFVKVISPEDYTHYWFLHSLWHIMMAFSLMCIFNVQSLVIRSIE